VTLSLSVFLALGLGCAPASCDAPAAGPERDRCMHKQILADPALPAAEVARLTATLEDPMIRVATVLTWARDHRGAVSDADRIQLCGLLTGQERNVCDRRLSAAHLSR
jgi:hypothetical protein